MRAGFQAMAAPSGVRATPASPKAPLRLSGAIIRNGTAVVIVFNCKLLSSFHLGQLRLKYHGRVTQIDRAKDQMDGNFRKSMGWVRK